MSDIPDSKRKSPHYVKNITVHLDRFIVNEMIKYPEVNWSVVCREAMRKYVEERKEKV